MDDLEDGEIQFEDRDECEHEKRRLDRDLRKKQKKLDKANKKQLKHPSAAASHHVNQGHVSKPGFLNIYGPDARANIEVKEKDKPIRLADVQGLVLWVLAEYTSPRWAFIKNKPLIDRVVLVLANGLSADLFKKNQDSLPNLKLLGEPVTVIGLNAQAKPAQTATALLKTSVSRKRKGQGGNTHEEGGKRQRGPDGGSTRTPPFSPSHYLLSVKEMESSNYPMPEICPRTGKLMCPDGFVPTQQYIGKGRRKVCVLQPPEDALPPGKGEKKGASSKLPEGTIKQEGDVDDGREDTAIEAPAPPAAPLWVEVEVEEEEEERMVGLDCEMCITAEGFELTRATLVDRQGRLLLDELCVPDNPITDYNTRYSGITAGMLADCPNRLCHIQEKVKALVSAETLLVGHSLDNDLKALKMVHSRILDTAHLYPHPRGPPFKSALKVLASRFLKRKIQDGSHDSAIDATTAMDLALLKIKHGPWFGTNEGNTLNMNKLTDVVSDHGARSCLIDRKDNLTRYATGTTDVLPVYTDDDAAHVGAKECASGSRKGQLIWVQFTELSGFYFSRAQHKRSLISSQSEEIAGKQAASPEASSADAIKSVDEDLSDRAGVETSAASGSGQEASADDHPDFSTAAEELLQKQLDSHVGKIWHASPPNTMVIVATGQGDTPEVRRLQESKYRRQNGLDGLPRWSFKDENDLKAVMEREIAGLCFCSVKQ